MQSTSGFAGCITTYPMFTFCFLVLAFVCLLQWRYTQELKAEILQIAQGQQEAVPIEAPTGGFLAIAAAELRDIAAQHLTIIILTIMLISISVNVQQGSWRNQANATIHHLTQVIELESRVITSPKELRLFDPASKNNWTLYWMHESNERGHFGRPYIQPYLAPSSKPNPEVFRGHPNSPRSACGTPENLAPLEFVAKMPWTMLTPPEYMRAIGLNYHNIIESLMLDQIRCRHPEFLAARFGLDPNFYLGTLNNIEVTPEMIGQLNTSEIYRVAKDIGTKRYALLMRLWNTDPCTQLGFPWETCIHVRELLRANHQNFNKKDELHGLVIEKVQYWFEDAMRWGTVALEHREHRRPIVPRKAWTETN